MILALFRMNLHEAAPERNEAPTPPPPKICYTYPTMMKPGTLIPYLKNVQKLYKSRDKFLKFC